MALKKVKAPQEKKHLVTVFVKVGDMYEVKKRLRMFNEFYFSGFVDNTNCRKKAEADSYIRAFRSQSQFKLHEESNDMYSILNLIHKSSDQIWKFVMENEDIIDEGNDVFGFD